MFHACLYLAHRSLCIMQITWYAKVFTPAQFVVLSITQPNNKPTTSVFCEAQVTAGSMVDTYIYLINLSEYVSQSAQLPVTPRCMHSSVTLCMVSMRNRTHDTVHLAVTVQMAAYTLTFAEAPYWLSVNGAQAGPGMPIKANNVAPGNVIRVRQITAAPLRNAAMLACIQAQPSHES